MEKQCNLSERGEEILLMGVMGGGGGQSKERGWAKRFRQICEAGGREDKNCPASLLTLKSWRPQKTGQ